ncbi:MAG: hypothetical protein KQA40_01670 [Candidatus Aenigmarchaeota archaeon]|nr:hypothetical protein [Candidatus Aenigmarchaeota archaeon]
MNEIFGIIGGILLIIAWFYEAKRDIKRHKVAMDLKYVIISMIATIFLLIYSILIKNLIFISINLIILILITFEILLTIFLIRRKK